MDVIWGYEAEYMREASNVRFQTRVFRNGVKPEKRHLLGLNPHVTRYIIQDMTPTW